MPDDEVRTWIDEAANRLRNAGYREIPVDFGNKTQGSLRALRREDFRIAWVFTRLHTFVILREATTATSRDIAVFTRDAVDWAKRVKGGLPNGLQTGVAVLAVCVTDRSDPDAVAEAHRTPDKLWAAFGLPVLIELDVRKAHTHAGDMSWGSLYQDFLGGQQRTVIGDLDGQTMQRSPAGREKWAKILSGAVALTLLALILLLLGRLLS